VRDPARTSAAAERRYRGYIQQAISCVSAAVLYTGPAPNDAPDEYLALLSRESPIRLTTSEGYELRLEFMQLGEFVPDDRFPGETRVATRAYYYALTDDSSVVLIEWHWDTNRHPEPHIHVPALDHPAARRRLHVPTGGRRVSIEQVVSWLIEEWGVRPARADYSEVLADTQARFDEHRRQD
jgi:hypothetical protein